MADAEILPKKSDLPVRAASAVVMLMVAGTALWLGGWVWAVFVVAVALGVLWEWRQLVMGFAVGAAARALWMIAGLVYVMLGAGILMVLRLPLFGGVTTALIPLVLVVATDVGAYFTGRTIGGPKIAPRVSPSKTWSGLIGGMVSATLALWLCNRAFDTSFLSNSRDIIVIGPLGAVLAQAGDFFESWMKRRAGAKDSGTLLPGHGGLFDRVDGLLAILAGFAVISAAGGLFGWW